MTRFRPLLLAFLLAAVAASSASAGSVCTTSCFQAPAGSGALLVFSGHGWGHGVGMRQYGAYGNAEPGATHAQILPPHSPGTGPGDGMSQYGAYGYAEHGSTYAQILAHYSRCTTLGPAATSTIRVLLAEK